MGRNRFPMSALGQTLPRHSPPVPVNVRYASNSDPIAVDTGCRLSAITRHRDKIFRDLDGLEIMLKW